MEKVLLNMKAISKTFGSVQALKEVSLDLYAGEVLALMGENGAGKSTLMNILSGSLQPTKGEIYLKGEKVTVPGPIAAKKLGISKIHQELQIVPEMSVAENIFLGRWMKKKGGSVDFKTMAAEARKYLEMLDVHVDPATKLKDLRIGEQQLVEIAKAISLNSEIIIMDEPTSAISEKEAEKLFTIIRKLRSEGKGIIYITHRMEEIFQIADRLTVMRDGTYIGTVKASETSKDEIIKMMVGRDMSEQYPKDPTEKGEIALKVENLTYTPPAGSFRRSLKNISLHVRHTLLPDGGKVCEIKGLEGTSGGIDRDNGFREGIKKNDKIEIVAVNNADWLREKAITVAEEMLQTNDEIDLFLALNDPMAEGAYIAAKNAGREGDILFVGFDGLPTPDGGIRSVMDGRLSMTQVYPTGGTEAIESAYQLLVEGKELDKTLTLTSEIVTPDNAEELLEKFGGSAE